MFEPKLKAGQKVVTIGTPTDVNAEVDAGVEGVITDADDDSLYIVSFEHNIFNGTDEGEDYWWLDDDNIEAVED